MPGQGLFKDQRPFTSLLFFMLIMVFFGFLFSMMGGGISMLLTGINYEEMGKLELIASKPNGLLAIKIQSILSTTGFFIIPSILYIKLGLWTGLNSTLSVFGTKKLWLFIAAALPFVANQAMYLVLHFNEWIIKIINAESLFAFEKGMEKTYQIALSSTTILEYILTFLLVVILPAIFEEVVFRGVIQSLLYRITKNIWAAMIISALVFSLFHFQFTAFLARFFLGFLLSWLVFASGKLIYSMLFHFLNNLGAFVMFLFTKETAGYDKTEFDNTSAILGVASLLLCIAVCVYLYKNREDFYPQKLNLE